MAVPLCPRSVEATLAAAVSSLALFAAVDWGIADFVQIGRSFSERLLMHAVFSFAMPLLPLHLSLRNALAVWTLKQSIHKRHVSGRAAVDRASIAIFAVCPLFIQVPLSASKDFDIPMDTTKGYEVLGVGALKDLCPLELPPREAFPDPYAAAAAMNTDQQQQQDSVTHHVNQKKYLHFIDHSFMDLGTIKEKEVLLRLGLVPEYSQLRFLRSRSRFQSVVTGLQAGGYVLSVVQRLAQHLAVCPLEALLCFLSVIIILQLLLELYACSHYQRPLLLHLNHQQFSQFWTAPRDYDTESSLERYGGIPHVIVSVFLVMLFSALSIYYSIHYMQSCLMCSVAALLFVCALFLWIIAFKPLINSDETSCFSYVLFFFSALIFLSSMVLAAISTAKDWDLFHSPTHNSFSWILPHVSS